MQIYLIRHVETQGNVTRNFNGITESKYTDYGRYMKRVLIEFLKNEHLKQPFDCIYTSPTRRAADTAEALSAELRIPLTEDPALLEFNFGIFDGLTVEQAQKRDPRAYASWMNNHLYAELPQGDSYAEKYKNSAAWMKELLKKDDQRILIVTHGATLRCLLSYLLDLSLEAGWHFDIPLGGFCRIEYENGYGILKELTTPPYQNNHTDYFKKQFIK